jgi:predicted nucleotide-binding protein
MARSIQQPRTYLTRAREEAAEKISEQIREGETLLPSAGRTVTLDDLTTSRTSWAEYTAELLKSLFTTDDLADEFRAAGSLPFGLNMRTTERFTFAVKRTTSQLKKLRSIQRRLEFFEVAFDSTPAQNGELASAGTEVFLVHGRDDGTKHAVARFLERLGLTPVILHEKPDKGRTIIEKFEIHSVVSYAIVLLTADDEGGLRGTKELKPRARQNVILELGYFIGKLTRSRVCALRAPEVEEPSTCTVCSMFRSTGVVPGSFSLPVNSRRLDLKST